MFLNYGTPNNFPNFASHDIASVSRHTLLQLNVVCYLTFLQHCAIWVSLKQSFQFLIPGCTRYLFPTWPPWSTFPVEYIAMSFSPARTDLALKLLIPNLACDFYSYSILRTIVLVPLTSLPPKLLRILVSTMAAGRFATLPSPTARQHPNQVHRRCPHSMGNAACAWFGRIPLWGWALCTTPNSILLLQIKHPKYGFRQQQ